MAKTKKKIGGPFLSNAVFCDSVVCGEDGALTVVRMIDQVTLTLPPNAPPDVPSKEKAILTSVEGIVSFKKGDAGKKHKLKLVMNGPSGNSKTVTEQPAEFRDELHGGFNLRIKTSIAVTEAGLYWLDVYLDGKRLTRMPLKITVNRAEPLREAAAKAKGLQAIKPATRRPR